VSTVPATQGPDARRRPRLPRGLGLDRFSGVYLWILFIVVFGIWTPSEFLTISTVHGVASTQAVTGIVALAVLIPLAAGLYDLSVGATANLTGMLAITLLNHGWAVVPAVVASMLVGVAIGLVNSAVVVKLGVNSFIATLGMSSILAAVLVIITGDASPIPPSSTAWNDFTQTTIAGFQIVVLYLIALAFVLWWLMAHTPTGRYLYAIVGRPSPAVFDPRARPLLDDRRPRRCALHLSERAVARLRPGAAAPSFRRGLPRLDSAPARQVQRLGYVARDFRARHRR
jgi:ribose transport system permease protein